MHNVPLTVSVGKHLEVREAPEGTFGPIIARLAGPADDEGQRAYAALFAASRDMLAALKLAEELQQVGVLYADEDLLRRVRDSRRAAIAKAEGRTHA